jgi:multidrug efflux pump subunit AcrA (membrane-fusion protein)
MLLRISLIVAILAGLGAGGLAYWEFSTQIPALTQQRDTEKTDKQAAQKELASTKATLKKTMAELAQTQQELADTKTELAKSEARADAQAKRADELAAKLTKTAADLEDTQNQLAAYKASDLTPDQVVRLNKDLKDAQLEIAAINAEKAVLQRTLASTKAELEKFIGEEHWVKLPAELRGKVVVVDPKWDFVVLNIGGDQGAVNEGEMLVSRDGKLVAKVVIRSVEKDRCIANIVPGWKLGEVIEGDVVTPAHPASS